MGSYWSGLCASYITIVTECRIDLSGASADVVQTNDKGPLQNCNSCPRDEGIDLKNI